ncbi:restriction endonuclease subunit S, partial [Morganella morganii]
MSELSYLKKLLDGAEVEWMTLGNEGVVEIANSGRKPVKASMRTTGKVPYYGANNIQDYVDGYTHDGEFVLIAEDGSASLDNYSIQYVTGKFWANNHVHVVRGKGRLNSRFLYHYLSIVNFVPFLSGGGRAKLTKGKLVEIPIPIPCPGNPEKSLSIQSEIVRILDAFTTLTAELTAELTARKKQYNYYRDQLLSF